MAPDPLGLAGLNLGAYTVDLFRGRGAFAYVYEGVEPSDSDSVALKVLRPGVSIQSQTEFANEGILLVQATGATRVVDLLDTGSEHVLMTTGTGVAVSVPFHYHVLELATSTLAELIVHLPTIDWATRLSLFRDVCLGVHQLHCRSIAHRDIKSENVLVFRSGSGLVAKVSDLGRARDLAAPGSAGVNYEFTRGDPSFSSPELLCGVGEDLRMVHIAADLYGLGSLLFEFVIGQGITGLAVGPNIAIVHAIQAAPVLDRQALYASRHSEIRSWYEPLFKLFEQNVPPAIRQPAGLLIRQLCDPDPRSRFPRVALGRRGQRATELEWLLRRADSMQIAYRNAERQAALIGSRKESK